MRCRLLSANAHRDAGELDDAAAAYQALIAEIAKESEHTSPQDRAMLTELGVEVRVELAREMLAQGQTQDARHLLEETLEKLAASAGAVLEVPASPLVAANLKATLAFAHLKQGEPQTALDLLDASLAGLGELPDGLAGATTEAQEILQLRASTKLQLGRIHSASEDLEVVRGLQDELMQTIQDEHNPKYHAGEGVVPDPRLWTSVAKTRMITAELKVLSDAAVEALPLAKEALHLLREVKRSDGRVPKSYALATFVEVKEMIAKLKGKRSGVKTLLAKSEQVSDRDDDTDSERAEPAPAPAPLVVASWAARENAGATPSISDGSAIEEAPAASGSAIEEAPAPLVVASWAARENAAKEPKKKPAKVTVIKPNYSSGMWHSDD